jgi:type II secretory pathway component GspD/PulD (secretin)
MSTNRPIFGIVLGFVSLLVSAQTDAQEGVPSGRAATPTEVPAKSDQAAGAPANGDSASNPDGKPVPGSDGKPVAKPREVAEPEVPKTNSRPTKPPLPANPNELKIRPDGSGRVRFNFQGQPWLNVLEWLAKISDLSLDWQEVPADFLNLRTQRSYTVAEARDLINRHLLDRGFTLLKDGEVLSVVNIKKLDPSLVPRVAPGELDEREPHEFVKVSFPLDSLTAETATEELKPMLSPNGRLTALKATNRVEALDAVVNLRGIREVLAHEQTQKGRKRLVQQFSLQYTRAVEVVEQLQDLLGIERKLPAPTGPQDPNQQQQMQQLQQQIQQMQQQAGRAGTPGTRQSAPVHLVVISRENAIVATAPADQMAIIEEAVKLIDVPSSRPQSLLKNANRMQIYRLASIDPEPIVKMLLEIGDLDPTTNLRIDHKKNAIIAEASLADHMTIRMLVKKLDGTDRKFEVIRLRRLDAGYVAGSIEFMMGEGDKKRNQFNGNPWMERWGGGGRPNEDDETKRFRVDADIEHNRLLLWANTVELDEINNLLAKLGEIPGDGSNRSQMRVLDTIAPEDVEQLLERLRGTWPGVAPNPLQIAPPAEPSAVDPADRKPRPGSKTPAQDTRVGDHPLLRNESREVADRSFPRVRLLGVAQESTVGPDLEEDNDVADPAPLPLIGKRRAERDPGLLPAPVRIGRSPDGRMIISSPDTQALDRLEDLLMEIAPPRKDYKIFVMKYKSTWAYGVAENLKDFFEEKEKNDKGSRRLNGWFGFQGGWQGDNEQRRLSKRRPLKFISDSDTNSILVTGADASQLKIIDELISMYDIPESKDSAAVRMTKIVKIEFSKARVIADAVKDVYRDLLSANDPAVQNGNNQNQNEKNQEKSSAGGYTINYNLGDEVSQDKPEPRMKFKGLLSIGVDELSNTLIVSASEALLKNVTTTIEALDEAARPAVKRMHVLKIERQVDAGELQKRLKNLVTRPTPHQPGHPPQPGQPQFQNGQPIPPVAPQPENN